MQYNGKENNKLIQMMQWCIFRFKKKKKNCQLFRKLTGFCSSTLNSNVWHTNISIPSYGFPYKIIWEWIPVNRDYMHGQWWHNLLLIFLKLQIIINKIEIGKEEKKNSKLQKKKQSNIYHWRNKLQQKRHWTSDF